MNIQDSNKLIAEFMGYGETQPYQIDEHGTEESSLFFDTGLKFHCSWNWLMPVLEKIDKICGIDLHEWDEYINNALCTKSKESTYKAVIEFINWHNQNKG